MHAVKRTPIVTNRKDFVSAWNRLAWNAYRIDASSGRFDHPLVRRHVYLDGKALGCRLEDGAIAALASATSASVEGLLRLWRSVGSALFVRTEASLLVAFIG